MAVGVGSNESDIWCSRASYLHFHDNKLKFQDGLKRYVQWMDEVKDSRVKTGKGFMSQTETPTLMITFKY